MTGLIVAALVAAGLIAAGRTAARRSARPPADGRGSRLLRAAARLLLLAAGAFLVARAGYILAAEHPGRPETYRHAWGGPYYIGFITVHVGPAVLALFLAGLSLYRTLTGRRRPSTRTPGQTNV
ncbi:hypothetical protein [Frankia sp. R82]|uniref:hypothetical protein n=1 Tax=Frankia sp. R82 TaxID=2950553 RepID=UPI002043B4EB|nr:hypothetical protein [Frankia sp. R82]MCM3885511.1 hypothetical protein [Frankia sp. R82]